MDGGPIRLTAGGTTTLVDPTSGAAEEFSDEDGVRFHPGGVIEESAGRFRRLEQEAVTHRGWSFADAADDTLVLRRDARSPNPFRDKGDDDREEIAIVDFGTGRTCARTEVTGWWIDAIAIPGCRAIIDDPRTGLTWLLARQ